MQSIGPADQSADSVVAWIIENSTCNLIYKYIAPELYVTSITITTYLCIARLSASIVIVATIEQRQLHRLSQQR